MSKSHPEIQNYPHLRQEALTLLRNLAPQSWTDHNTSDPGITLLEQLCYAMTDLGYRIDFDIADLLAKGGEDAYRLFYTPRQILSTGAVTFPDYRQLLLDHLEVENVRISEVEEEEPALYYAPFSEELLLAKDRDELLPEEVYRSVFLKGLLTIATQKEHNADEEALKTWLEEKLYGNRALCTDFEAIDILAEIPIKVQLHIELGEAQNKEQLIARIWQILDQYISPELFFQSLSSLKAHQLIEQIFNGPSLQYGFLQADDLANFQKRAELRRSDIIHALMNLAPEIRAIRVLNIAEGTDAFTNTAFDWIIQLNPEKGIIFNLESSEIKLYTENLEIPFSHDRARNYYEELQQKITPKSLDERELDIQPLIGEDREVEVYTSIREHLPEVYGITPYGLPETATTDHKAKAQQLSAYLLFFEQILANQFTQLEQLPKLLSVDREEGDQQSYFAQTLDDIPAIEGIYQHTSQERLARMQSFFEDKDESRINRLLDHFLGRFAEQFSDHIIDPSQSNSNAFSNPIDAKRTILKSYPALSANRGMAYDYAVEGWETDNISGTEKRIARLLGLRNLERNYLSEGLDENSKQEGFYLVEHILLRPIPADDYQEEALLACLKTDDPYSLKVSYVFHQVGRFWDEAKRRFTERLLRAETPAHIHIQTYWLNPNQMKVFEKAYQSFLEELKLLKNQEAEDSADNHQFAFRIARDRLMDVLFLFHPQSLDSPMGIPYPIRDIPLHLPIDNIDETTDGKWEATIQIQYPQVGIIYQLCNRDKEFQGTTYTTSIPPSGAHEQNGIPYLELATPPIDRDTTFWIRAKKQFTIGSEQKTLKYVFLKQPIRVRVGVAPVQVSAELIEIDYGTQAHIILSNIQANVDYRLYTDLEGDGTLELIADFREDGTPFNGLEDTSITIPTAVVGGIKEDRLIVVKGSRDEFGTNRQVGSIFIRVRANPALPIFVETPIVPYGGTSVVKVVSLDTQHQTQASVTYHLFYREISDPEFVHQRTFQPTEADVLSMDNGHGATVRIQRPRIPNTDANHEPEAYHMPPVKPIAYSKEGIVNENIDDEDMWNTVSPSNDGEEVVFDTSGMSIQEDTLLIVVATKSGHEQDVVLGSGTQTTTIGAVLVQPDPSPIAAPDPNPLPSGQKGKVTLNNVQTGVKYYLQFSNGVQQPFNFLHDEITESPRKDGVGFSKVSVDGIVGNVAPLPLVLETRNPLTQTRTLQVMGEKIQTGVKIKIGEVTIEV